jgi:outer membrane receptor protein involved in Fe transport
MGVFRGATQVRETFPSYTQVDLYAGVLYDSWTVRAFANNVGDERGVLRSGLDSLSPTFVTYIEPRTVGLLFGKSF